MFVILILVLLIIGAAVWGIRYYNNMLGKMNIVTLDKNLYETYSEETTLPEETAATEASASPRKPRVPMWLRSSALRTLLVA